MHYKQKQVTKITRRQTLLRSTGRLLLLLLLLSSVAAWRGQLFGLRMDGSQEKKPEHQLTAEDCRLFLKSAMQIRAISDHHYNIYDESNALIGSAYWYSGEQGFGGRVPFHIITDGDHIIKGILPGKHYESSAYLEDIENSGFLNQWNGVKPSEATGREVDVISGATLTSQAIIQGVRKAASGQEIRSGIKFLTLENVLSIFLLSILVIAYFQPRRFMKYRFVLQLTSVVIFGFWLGHFLSLAQMVNWVSGGTNWKLQWIILIILFISVAFPLFFNKAFYCHWVCPYGAAQELCGKAKVKKLQLPSRLHRRLKYLQEVFFLIIMIILLTGFIFDLALVEPFQAFSLHQARFWVMGFAGFFLVLSLFLPKAWCRYFCPTGYILEWIRK